MQRTTAWLQDRLGELRDQQRNADRSVADFKTKNNIVAANSQPIKQDELNLLNSQLVAARNRTSEVQAKLDRIEAIIRSSSSATTPGAPDPTVSDTLTNPVITKLRDKYLDYAAREADYSAKYGSNHYAVLNLRRQIRELRASILDELRRIAETYKSDLEIAKQHQDDLEKTFASAVTQSGRDRCENCKAPPTRIAHFMMVFCNDMCNRCRSNHLQLQKLVYLRVHLRRRQKAAPKPY